MIDFEGGVLRGARCTLLVRPRQNQGGSLPHANGAAALSSHLLSRTRFYAVRIALLIAVNLFQHHGSERYARPRSVQQGVRFGVCMRGTRYSMGNFQVSFQENPPYHPCHHKPLFRIHQKRASVSVISAFYMVHLASSSKYEGGILRPSTQVSASVEFQLHTPGLKYITYAVFSPPPSRFSIR